MRPTVSEIQLVNPVVRACRHKVQRIISFATSGEKKFHARGLHDSRARLSRGFSRTPVDTIRATKRVAQAFRRQVLQGFFFPRRKVLWLSQADSYLHHNTFQRFSTFCRVRALHVPLAGRMIARWRLSSGGFPTEALLSLPRSSLSRYSGHSLSRFNRRMWQ